MILRELSAFEDRYITDVMTFATGVRLERQIPNAMRQQLAAEA